MQKQSFFEKKKITNAEELKGQDCLKDDSVSSKASNLTTPARLPHDLDLTSKQGS